MNVVWFKRDLRTSDHRALSEAASLGPILPLYVAEPELWRQPDVSARQWSFASECLLSLRAELAALGAPLVVRVGDIREVLTALNAHTTVTALYSHEETGNGWTFDRDRAVRSWCREHGVPWHEYPQNGVLRPHKQRNGWAAQRNRRMAEPLVHPPFAIKAVRGVDPGQIPGAGDLGLGIDNCPGRQAGGRQAAIATLESFLTERGATYRRAMSSPLTAETQCSRLSPHLAWGSLSMKEAQQATTLRLQQATAKPWAESLKSFSSRLHWHCHFMQKLEDEPSIEHSNLHPAYNGLRQTPDDSASFESWRRGETGVPFVDACMRYLNAAGWINFRMRAMLMSFASYQLWLDWRKPGEHLARQFTDYEPGIHWSQVQMQSGTTGMNTPRIYNPVKQGYDQDPRGEFIRRWIPELESVPDAFLQEPWRWEGHRAVLDKHYPAPIVDHLAARKRASDRIHALRRASGHRALATDIARRHGSRKRSTGRRQGSSRQWSMDFT